MINKFRPLPISYWFNLSLHLAAHPQEIRVYGGESGLLRIRRGRYDTSTGALIELTQMLSHSPTPDDMVSSIAWDRYGNLTCITDRRGAFVEYLYDSHYRQYAVTIISGGAGIVPLRSYIEWDFALGVRTKETDWNGNSINYVYDTYGRLTEVYSPYDNFGQRGAVPAVRHSVKIILSGASGQRSEL